jgi:hypothetical protein
MSVQEAQGTVAKFTWEVSGKPRKIMENGDWSGIDHWHLLSMAKIN